MNWFNILKVLQPKTGYAQLDLDNIVEEEDNDCCDALLKDLKQIINKHNIVFNAFRVAYNKGVAYGPISQYDFKPDLEEHINNFFSEDYSRHRLRNNACELIRSLLAIAQYVTIEMMPKVYPLERVTIEEVNKWVSLKAAYVADIKKFEAQMKDCPPLKPFRAI